MSSRRISNRADTTLTVGPFPHEAKDVVGPGQFFPTIEHLLQPQYYGVLYGGQHVKDTNYGVTWELYLENEVWYNRLYNGTFYVKACDAGVNSISISGSPLGIRGNGTLDGVSCVAEDIVFLGMQWPQLNGVWIVKAGLWVRHPIFDQSADKLSGITFVVSEGTQYANSQWEFTTIGPVTPATLASSYQELASDPALLLSYTWLNFEMINGCYPQRDTIEIGSAIERFDFNNFVDTTDGDVNIGGVMFLLPGKPYYISKIDASINKVLFGGTGEVPYWVLLEQNDWVEFFLKENNNVSSDNFGFKSNRINKTLTPAVISANGKLTDIPLGYRVYCITSVVDGNSGDVYMDFGSAGGLSDIDVSASLTASPYTKVVDDNTISEVWLSCADWSGGTVEVSILIVKEG
jgi:hypothetical protein